MIRCAVAALVAALASGAMAGDEADDGAVGTDVVFREGRPRDGDSLAAALMDPRHLELGELSIAAEVLTGGTRS